MPRDRDWATATAIAFWTCMLVAFVAGEVACVRWVGWWGVLLPPMAVVLIVLLIFGVQYALFWHDWFVNG